MSDKPSPFNEGDFIEINEADLLPPTAGKAPYPWPTVMQPPGKQAVDIILLIDTSGSMGAADYQPNRLAAAQDAARLFARHKVLQGYRDRVGVIGFGGQPTTVCPLTDDLDQVTAAIGKLTLTHTGTMIGHALRAAYDELERHNSPRQGIVLLSDGADEYDTSRPEGIAAKHRHVKLFTIGIGTLKGGAAKLPHGMQTVYLNEKLLRRLAEVAGGDYLYAPDLDALRRVYRRLADY